MQVTMTSSEPIFPATSPAGQKWQHRQRLFRHHIPFCCRTMKLIHSEGISSSHRTVYAEAGAVGAAVLFAFGLPLIPAAHLQIGFVVSQIHICFCEFPSFRLVRHKRGKRVSAVAAECTI